MLKQLNKSLRLATILIITIILTLGFSISLQSLFAAWTAPSATPPTNNIADLNLGGGLSVAKNALVIGNFSTIGNVGIGILNPGYKFDVQGGQINASNGLCIAGICKTSWADVASSFSNADTVDFIHASGFAEQMADATDLSQRLPKSGFYQTSAPTSGWYPGASSWQHVISSQHSNTANNYALQIVGGFFDQDLYFRKTNGSGTTAWNKFIYQNSAGNTTVPGNLTFSAANPYITASSYLVIPGGAYFNSGTVYTEAPIQARGGIHNDTNSYLTISGGTAGNTYFSGNVGIGTTNPTKRLDVAGDIHIGGQLYGDGSASTYGALSVY